MLLASLEAVEVVSFSAGSGFDFLAARTGAFFRSEACG